MDVCSIVLADDHVMFRQGVKRIIEETPGLEVVGEADDGLELLNLLKARLPELVLLDISMPHLRGLEATREIKKLYPRVKIIFLTMHRSKEFYINIARWGGPPCSGAGVPARQPIWRPGTAAPPTPAIFHFSLCLYGNDRWYDPPPPAALRGREKALPRQSPFVFPL
jgi:CheY-like chemotaxis protein